MSDPMQQIQLTELERWQVLAMERECEALAAKLALARELQTTALTAILQRHGGDVASVYRVSDDGLRLERVTPQS